MLGVGVGCELFGPPLPGAGGWCVVWGGAFSGCVAVLAGGAEVVWVE